MLKDVVFNRGASLAGETGANDSIILPEHLAAVRENIREPRGAADANARRGAAIVVSRHFARFPPRGDVPFLRGRRESPPRLC